MCLVTNDPVEESNTKQFVFISQLIQVKYLIFGLVISSYFMVSHDFR